MEVFGMIYIDVVCYGMMLLGVPVGKLALRLSVDI